MGQLNGISLKFIDIMIGVVLGLGFTWWPQLSAPWQYAAFIFIYIDLVDYWIDVSGVIKRFPSKKEFDLLLEVAIIFTMFLYIYTAQLTMFYLLLSVLLYKAVDMVWLLRIHIEHRPAGRDRKFVRAWISTNTIDFLCCAALAYIAIQGTLSQSALLAVYISVRVATRIFASLQYKELFFRSY